MLQIEFQPVELETWLRKFAEADPKAALRLISQVQQEIINKYLDD